jgi:hypothetical protein
MKGFPRYCLLTTAVLAMTVLGVSLSQRLSTHASALRSLDDWTIPELADHLNRAGLHVRLQSTQKDGVIGCTAFLTTTAKDWNDLNRLQKDPSRLPEWRGTVYCEQVGRDDRAYLVHLWGEHCYVAGPFIFYGDAELLQRIGAILAPLAASTAP